MLNRILATDENNASLVLRLLLGAVFFAHGSQKMLGFSATMDFLTGDALGLPWIVAFLVICAEFFGALGLLAGVLTRVAAGGIGLVMLGAVNVHRGDGFFMNWGSAADRGEGFEYHLLAIAICVALVILGGGRFSGDGVLAERVA